MRVASIPPMSSRTHRVACLVADALAASAHTAWAFGHPRAGIIVKRFDEHQLTAPIFATGWDGNVRVTLFADGRIGVRTENGQ
jgi:hypothetical protein